MKILLHICCAPCSIYPIKELSKKFDTIEGYFYRHNIHPYKECLRRENEVKKYTKSLSISMIYEKEYKLETFIKNTIFKKTERCFYCYTDRIMSSAIKAKKGNFDCFSTTLLYSKFQKHQLIRSIAKSVSNKIDIPFYYDDFRVGWNQGIYESKNLKMYRQSYCGCIYSEKERYYLNNKSITKD